MSNLSHTIAILGFNNHKITLSVLNYLRKSGCNDHILFYDNGSWPPFENLITDSNITYHRNEKNIYVNPAWNEIFNMVETKYLTLLNNDCFIKSQKYFDDVIPHMEKNDIILSSCKTKNVRFSNFLVQSIYKLKYFRFNNTPLQYSSTARRQGWLMTLNLEIYKKIDYQIPDYLQVWYGDDWIMSQILLNKLNYAIYTNRYALHVKATSTSKVTDIIQKDIENIEIYGDWYKQITEEMHSKKYA